MLYGPELELPRTLLKDQNLNEVENNHVYLFSSVIQENGDRPNFKRH